MGSIEQIPNIGQLLGDVGELLNMFISFLKGDISSLSSEGSAAGIFTSDSGE